MSTYPKSTPRVLRMLMRWSSVHVTLLRKECEPPKLSPQSDLGRRADSHWALLQISSYFLPFCWRLSEVQGSWLNELEPTKLAVPKPLCIQLNDRYLCQVYEYFGPPAADMSTMPWVGKRTRQLLLIALQLTLCSWVSQQSTSVTCTYSPTSVFNYIIMCQYYTAPSRGNISESALLFIALFTCF